MHRVEPDTDAQALAVTRYPEAVGQVLDASTVPPDIRLSVEFAYPENWQITDEQASDWPRGVSLETPNGGFWWLQLHPPTNPRDLAAEVLNTMRLEYAELEAEPVTELIGETEVVGFDMHFYCLDLLVTAQARSLQLGQVTLLILSQAEDREFERLEPVFFLLNERDAR